MNQDMYEDRSPRHGFNIPEIGELFTVVNRIWLGSTSQNRAEFKPGTIGQVIGIREPLKPDGGYVGCIVKYIDDRFEKIYPAGMVVPWDEISDPEKFVFLSPNS